MCRVSKWRRNSRISTGWCEEFRTQPFAPEVGAYRFHDTSSHIFVRFLKDSGGYIKGIEFWNQKNDGISNPTGVFGTPVEDDGRCLNPQSIKPNPPNGEKPPYYFRNSARNRRRGQIHQSTLRVLPVVSFHAAWWYKNSRVQTLMFGQANAYASVPFFDK